MIANLIGGFIAILIGVVLVGPLATEVSSATATVNTIGSLFVCIYLQKAI